MGAPPRRLARLTPWIRPLLIAVGVGFAVVFARRLDLTAALAALARADPRWVAVAMLLNGVVRLGTRVMRTRALLSALPGEVPFGDLAHLIYGSVALGYVVSPIAGSAARVFALQRHGVSTESMVAVQLWEKMIAGCALAAFAGPLLLAATPAAVHYPLVIATVIGALGPVLAISIVAGVRRRERGAAGEPTGKVGRWLLALGRALARLHDGRVVARAFAWSLLSELSDVGMLALALHALDLPVEPAACVLGYIAVNLSSAVPSTPGQLGVFEGAAAWALIASGLSAEHAIAGAVLYHLIHLAPVLLLGTPSLLRLRAARRDPAASAGS